MVHGINYNRITNGIKKTLTIHSSSNKDEIQKTLTIHSSSNKDVSERIYVEQIKLATI
jgi:hypothetical protein